MTVNISQDAVRNAVVVANIIEAVSSTIKDVAGNDISNQINGSDITREVLSVLIGENINSCLKIQ